MKLDYSKIIVAAVLAIGLVVATFVPSMAFRHRHADQHTISVKGMASRDFTSDFVVWECVINQVFPSPQEGVKVINEHSARVLAFLQSHGIKAEEVETSPVSYNENNESFWDNRTESYRTVKNGYNVQQRIKVSSRQLDKVDAAARRIGDLLGEGVWITSLDPQYYYTQLADLKLEMLGEAALDARQRADQIAGESGAKVGALKTSSMGVFQILGRFSASEEYSWGGTFNTTNRDKTATITVTSVFIVK